MPSLGSTTPWICWPENSGFPTSTWLADIGRSLCLRRPESRRRLQHILACFSSELCRLVFAMHLATFERLMDRVLQGLRWSRCLVYLDDIIDFDGALTNLTLIFERLRSYGLQLKSTKCHLFRSSVPFLGHIVGRHGLECDPAKIDDVKSWPVSVSKSCVNS